jgi:hypothetical protein
MDELGALGQVRTICDARLAGHHAGDRTRHAARPAATGTQLGSSDWNYLDPGLDEAPIRLDIALIGNRDLGLDGQRVVAVVPLLALRGHRVETGVDQP